MAQGFTKPEGPVGPTGAQGDTGDTGAQGDQGIQGDTGAAGQGVPAAGAADQHLAKIDGTDYNTEWVDPPSGVSPLTTKGDVYTYDSDDQRLAVGTNDHVLTADSGEATGLKWAAVPYPAPIFETPPFAHAGVVAAVAGTMRLYAPVDRTIIDVRLSVGVADASAVTTFDVHKDGTTIFTTQGNRPEVAATAFVDSLATPDVTAWAAGSYLTVDVDAATAAEDALLIIRYTVD